MNLESVEIFDFKSIKHEKIEINGNQLCFVGKNECGKSSIIQAISYLNFLDYEMQNNFINKSSTKYPNGFPVIAGVFQLETQSITKLRTLLSNQSKDAEILDKLKIRFKSFYLQIKRWGNGVSNLSIIMTDKETFAIDLLDMCAAKAKFVDDFFKELYPIIEYYENEELLIEPATIEDLLGNDSKFETFRRLLILGGCSNFELLNQPDDNFTATYLSRIESNLNSIFKKHYKQDESITISLRPNWGNKLNLIIKDSSEQSFSIEERSPGFRYYFSFLVNKLWTKSRSGNKNTILLLDEPGASLHPNGAKDLLKTFNEIAESGQIFYTTHNPFLAIRNNVDSLIFVTKSPVDGTKTNRKPFLNRYQILRLELGILLNDSFLLGDINLVVEGNTEKLAFHRLFQMEKYQELEWLNIYNADGVTNISQAINYLGNNNLKLSGIAFLDSDAEANNEKKKRGFINAMKEKNWAWVEVNDAFNDSYERTFEDLFPQDLYVNAFNKYCHSLKNLDVFDKEYIDLEYKVIIRPPITKVLLPYFYSFIDEARRKDISITKQDIMRILLNDIDNLELKEKVKALENCFKILDLIKAKNKTIEKYVGN